jgi:hypothetical protein
MTVFDIYVAAFDKEASRYHPEVYQRKQQELLEKMNALLNVLFIAQLRNIRKKSIQDFKKTVESAIKSGSDQFASRLLQAQEDAKSYFETQASSTSHLSFPFLLFYASVKSDGAYLIILYYFYRQYIESNTSYFILRSGFPLVYYWLFL